MLSSLTKRSFQLAKCVSTSTRKASTKANTAYDEALKLIALDKKERLDMLQRVEKEITKVTSSGSPAQLSALNNLKFDLQVKSELNDPQVQKNFNNGQVDMSQPVYRYMRQKQFEKAPKTKLMERLTQMNVIPDVLSVGLEPTVELNLNLNGGQLEPGVFTKPEESMVRPEVTVTNFHTETRLYTLMLVDPDSPDVANQTYQQYCHWLVTNVPLSATSNTVQGGDAILDYIPPHPQKGTKYHRYTLIAFEQPNKGQDKIDVQLKERDGFNVKALEKTHNLTVSGSTFFRQVWDESVTKIYNDILKQPEPVYGKPPKEQRYIQRAVYY
ncbi:PEBP-like protein [Backusella circina FSU 941]|nr:PEBP-like protein [Backusella circina FSU 941]